MDTVSVLWGVTAVCLFLVMYTYAGYPALLWLITRRQSAPRYDSVDEWPSVSMIVAAHNEEEAIGAKLDNVAAVDYPGRFQCVIVSDSTDETDAIVMGRGGDRVSLLSLDDRRGKSRALNEAVAATDSDVVVFSDANTMYDPDAVRELVAPLGNPSVGCTTGRLEFYDETGETAESAYWWYELTLRRLEARLGTTVAVNGGILALRREDYDPLPESALTDDSVIALRQLIAGRRVVFVPDATATEETAGGLWAEFDRRVRIGAGNFQTLAWFPGLLSPRNGIVAIQFFSHKVLRWITPGVLGLLASLTVALVAMSGSTLAKGLLATELLGLLFGLVGSVSAAARRVPVFKFPAYFLAMNLALAVGFIQFLAGPTVETWEPTRS